MGPHAEGQQEELEESLQGLLLQNPSKLTFLKVTQGSKVLSTVLIKAKNKRLKFMLAKTTINSQAHFAEAFVPFFPSVSAFIGSSNPERVRKGGNQCTRTSL